MLGHSQIEQMLALYQRERAAQRPLVLATLLNTQGSSYRKAGAQMLFAADTQVGLLSGGCLESDLREHATRVFRNGAAQRVRYDMRHADDELYGLGSGCQGALDIFLQRVDAANDWQPLAYLSEQWRQHRVARLALVIQAAAGVAAGSVVELASTAISGIDPQELHAAPGNSLLRRGQSEVFVLQVSARPQILILGGGVDARPLAQLCAFMGWHGTVYDHRAAYASSEHFPRAEIIHAPAAQLTRCLASRDFAAAVVMSHHLAADLDYLKQLADSAIPYLGLLGPPARRERLLKALGDMREKLSPRLHAPVGLNLGGGSPEAIALAIVAQIHQRLSDAQPAQG